MPHLNDLKKEFEIHFDTSLFACLLVYEYRIVWSVSRMVSVGASQIQGVR